MFHTSLVLPEALCEFMERISEQMLYFEYIDHECTLSDLLNSGPRDPLLCTCCSSSLFKAGFPNLCNVGLQVFILFEGRCEMKLLPVRGSGFKKSFCFYMKCINVTLSFCLVFYTISS